VETAVSNEFWAKIEAQLEQLKTAKTADDVLRILPGRSPGEGFFEGGGGDDGVDESLYEAGWQYVWSEANYYWCMKSPDGTSFITYVEGDIYPTNTRAQ
jgi:hypothetical protein